MTATIEISGDELEKRVLSSEHNLGAPWDVSNDDFEIVSIDKNVDAETGKRVWTLHLERKAKS